jgi:hypothetical protein
MRGHENIISLRKKGMKPSGQVSLNDFPMTQKYIQWEFAQDGLSPSVCVDGDSIHTLDLRFLVELQVHIASNDPDRGRLLAQKARKAGADLVVCVAGDKGAIWRNGDEKWLSF